MTPAQFDLVNRTSAPWLTLWLIADFPSGKSYAVGAQGGGTYGKLGDERGQYATDAKGVRAWARSGDRAYPAVAITWPEVGRWVASLPVATRERAASLQAERRRIQGDYPSPYPGIGRAYCWDACDERHTGNPCEQCDADRAELAAAYEKREVEVEAWQKRDAEHCAAVATFLASVRPSDEPTDLLELLAVGE